MGWIINGKPHESPEYTIEKGAHGEINVFMFHKGNMIEVAVTKILSGFRVRTSLVT